MSWVRNNLPSRSDSPELISAILTNSKMHSETSNEFEISPESASPKTKIFAASAIKKLDSGLGYLFDSS
jgi:hypothetical protein